MSEVGEGEEAEQHDQAFQTRGGGEKCSHTCDQLAPRLGTIGSVQSGATRPQLARPAAALSRNFAAGSSQW